MNKIIQNKIDQLDSLQSFYDKKMLENATRSNVFIGLSDVEVEEIVPRFYIRVPVPYIHRSEYDSEWVFGIYWKTLFTLGKKKEKRFLWLWELPKNKRKNSVIKFRRYGELNAEDTKSN